MRSALGGGPAWSSAFGGSGARKVLGAAAGVRGVEATFGGWRAEQAGAQADGGPRASLQASLRELHSRASSRSASAAQSLDGAGCAQAVAQLLAADPASAGGAAAAGGSARCSLDLSGTAMEPPPQHRALRCSGGGGGTLAAIADAINAAAAATGCVPACLRITLDPSGLAALASHGGAGSAAGDSRPASQAGSAHTVVSMRDGEPAGPGAQSDLGAALAQLLGRCSIGSGASPRGVAAGAAPRRRWADGGAAFEVAASHASSAVAPSIDQLITKVEAELAPQVCWRQPSRPPGKPAPASQRRSGAHTAGQCPAAQLKAARTPRHCEPPGSAHSAPPPLPASP